MRGLQNSVGARARVVVAVLAVVWGFWGCTAPVPDRPLVVALAGEPTSLDPHLQDNTVTHSLLFNVYEGLTAFDDSMRVLPALAERWYNLGNTVWRFVLRPGVRFHDGTPLTSEDVVASLRRAHGHPDSLTSAYLVGIEEIQAVDEETVEIVLERPQAPLLNKLAFVAVLPASAPQRVEQPIGTGPYRFVSVDDQGAVELEAFDRYWGVEPRIERIQVIPTFDVADRLQLSFDAADIAVALGTNGLEAISERQDWTLLSTPSLSVSYLGVNVRQPPLDDVRVRRAIDRALDRQELAAHSRGGNSRPAFQIVPHQVFGFVPDLPERPRDLALARSLLAEAGHPAGVDLTLDLYESQDPEPLMRQLGEVGIRITPRSHDWNSYLRIIASRGTELFLGGVICPTGDASDLLDSEVHSPDPERGFGHHNSYGYSNPELDSLIEAASTQLSLIQRRELLKQSVKIVAEDLPMIPLVVPYQVSAVRGPVVWAPRPDTFFKGIEVRWSEDRR